MAYVLVTPAKNEQEFLPIITNSIINQTQLPKYWLIVDGRGLCK